LELNQIYAPVNGDLKKVEEALLAVSQVDFPWLAQLLSHSLGAGGKRIRPALTLLSGQFYNYRFDPLLHMAVAIELMHTATLIHDDAIDKSDTRRGRATILSFGVDPLFCWETIYLLKLVLKSQILQHGLSDFFTNTDDYFEGSSTRLKIPST
jgi:hypothetical protein